MSSQMDTKSFNVPVSMLRQFYFCRRIPYFSLLRGLQAPAGAWVSQGISFHEKTQMLLKRRRLTDLGVPADCELKTQLKLYDSELKLHGICDAVLESSAGIFPLEFKLQEQVARNLGNEVQLTAYAMLLEKKLNRDIERGFILHGSRGRSLQIHFSAELRDKVSTAISTIESDCRSGLTPPSVATERQCGQCEFLNFCADRL